MNQDQTELLKVVFESDPTGLVVLLGQQLMIQMANPAFCAVLPDPQYSPLGRRFEEVWGGADLENGVEGIRQVLETGEPLLIPRVEIRYPDGRRQYVSIRARRLAWKGEQGVLLAFSDRSDMVQSLEQAEQASKLAREQAIRRSAELDAVLDALPDAVVIYDAEDRVTNANRAARALLNFDPVGESREALLQKLVVHRLDGSRATHNDLPAVQDLEGQWTRSMRLVVEVDGGKELQIVASTAPLFMGDQPVGAVAMWSDVTELTRSRTELEALVRVAGVLRDTYVQEEMFPIILNQVRTLTRADGVSILMSDSATDDLVVLAASGVWDNTVGLRLQAGEGVSHLVMETGQPYHNNEIQKDERLAKHIFVGGLPCGACLPLRAQGAEIGVLWIGRKKPIGDEEVQLLRTIADIAASSLYRARLFEQTQLRFQRLSALHSIDMAITSSLDLNLTLNVLLDQVVSQMGVDAADILLYDAAGHWLEYAAGRGFRVPSERDLSYSLADSPAGQVALERQPLMIPDLSQLEMNVEQWLPRQEGFQAYFAAPLVAKGQVKGVIELFHREKFYPDAEWMEFLETLATQAAIALDGAELFSRLQRSNDDLQRAYDATIEGWSRALELRDRETEGHSRRVTEMTIRLARRLNISDDEIANYRRGVLLHDIGKMAIPDSILLKEGPLTEQEQEIMRMHPVYAFNLLKPIHYLRFALDIPYCHHEWWNGQGYPRGLKGEEIPLSARVFAVVDVYDALTNKRTYRPPWSEQRALEYIRTRAGTQFDPRVVEEFLRMQRGSSRVNQSRSY